MCAGKVGKPSTPFFHFWQLTYDLQQPDAGGPIDPCQPVLLQNCAEPIAAGLVAAAGGISVSLCYLDCSAN